MGLFRLRLELRAVCAAIDEIRDTINRCSEAIRANKENRENKPPDAQTIKAVISLDDETKRNIQKEGDRQYGVQNFIRWAAWLAFAAACIYAGIAYRQWRTQIKNAKIDERPWVTIADWKHGDSIVPNKPIGAHTAIRNVGKSPALDLTVQFDDQILAPTEPFKFTIRDFGNNNTKHPGSFYQDLTYGFDLQTVDILTDDQYRKIVAGKLRLYIFWQISYRDAFGDWHWGHACGYFIGGGKIADYPEACPFWNDTDGYEQK